MRHCARLFSVAIAFLQFFTTRSDAAEAVWIGPATGAFHIPANWSTGLAPNSTTAVRIDDDPTRNSRVESAVHNSAGLLTVDAGDTLAVTNSQFFAAGLVSLDGTISVEGSGQFNAALLLNPGSELRLSGASTTATLGFLSNEGDIHGGGRVIVGAPSNSNIAYNHSSIRADNAAVPLTLQLTNRVEFMNDGRLMATSGGKLQILGQYTQSDPVGIVGGRIEAHPGSVVSLQTYSYFENSVLAAIEDDDPLTSAPRFEFVGGKLKDVALEGTIKVTGAIFLGTVQNRGVMTFGIPQGTSQYHATIGGEVSLMGGGTVVLDGSTTVGLFTGGTVDRLVNVDNVVRGRGELAVSWVPITNRGVIQADVPTPPFGGDMVFYNGTSTAPMINSGVMKAINGGTLRIGTTSISNWVDNYEGALAGQIIAGQSSQIRLGNATVVGGIIRAEGDTPETRGKFIVDGTPTFKNNTLQGFIRAQTTANAPAILNLQGKIYNTGTLNARPLATAPTELLGGGEIILETVTSGSSLTVNAPLTNVDNVIHGSGTISGPGTYPLTNRGTIRSDGLLQFGDLLDIVNSGRIEAVAGTRIVTSKRELIQNYENGVDGVIHAADGGVVQIGGYCCGGVDGGILSTEGSGIIQVLNDSILKDIHNIGNLQFGYILARGTFVNDGLIQGTMRVASPVFRIDGSGQWETTGSQLDGSLFINGPGHTIAGSGGGALVSSAAVVVNEGTIRATDGTFNIASSAVSNSGLIHAPVGRTLGIDSQLGRIENTGNMLADGTITIKASAGIYNFDEGQIDVRGQLTLQQTVLRNRPDGMIVGTGTIVGTIANGPLVVNEGVIEPGAGLATLQIGDDFQQLASGRLQMELSAGEDPASDVLAINGLATLAGTLVATLVGEESLSLHDSFTLLTASGGITGIFEQLELPTLADGLYWHMQYSASEVRAFVDDVMPGDFNRDQSVDAADYIAWRKNGGSDVELSYWQTNFAHSAGGEPSPPEAVPEPASIWMLLSAVAVGTFLPARPRIAARP